MDAQTYDVTKLIAASECEGWTLGYVGIPWPGPWPKCNGDLFVADPQGHQAGLAWESAGPAIQRICGPSDGKWGVFQVRFPYPVMAERDLVRNFHAILPLLKAAQASIS